MTYVFLSYAQKNQGYVHELLDRLRAAGIDVWVDQEGIEPGTPCWEEAIRAAIQHSLAVVLVASPQANASPNVRGELHLAKLYKRPILPIWIQGKEWPDCIPMGFIETQYVDARDNKFEGAVLRIIGAINKLRATGKHPGGEAIELQESDRTPGPASSISSYEQYIQELRKRYSEVTFPGISGVVEPPDFEQIYVFQHLRKERLPYDRVMDESGGRLLVEDVAGAGKSILFKRIVLDLCREGTASPSLKRFPIVVEANAFEIEVGNQFDQELVRKVTEEYRLSPAFSQEIMEAIIGGRGDLVLDGLDEINQEQRNILVRKLLSSSLLQNSNNRAYITSRPLGSALATHFRSADLSRFDSQDAVFLVHGWQEYADVHSALPATASRNLEILMRKVNSLPNIDSSVLGLPLYLTYIILALVAPNFDDNDNPLELIEEDNKVVLLQRILEHLIPEWEKQKGRIPPGEHHQVLWFLGFCLHRYPRVSEVEFRGRLSKLPKDNQLRMMPPERVDESIHFWLESGVVQKKRNANLKFWHQELQEFCAARYLWWDDATYEQVEDDILDDPDWDQVVSFYSQLEQGLFK